MAEDVGRRVATVAEAREMLGCGRSVTASCRLATSAILDLSRLLPGRLLLAAARRPRRRRDQGRGHRHGRLRPLGAALLRRRRARSALGTRSALYLVAQPRQALDPDRPQVRRRPRGLPAAGRATPTSCSRASAPASSTGSASATSACARSTRGSSTARSPATASTGRTPPAPATTPTTWRSTGCSA